MVTLLGMCRAFDEDHTSVTTYPVIVVVTYFEPPGTKEVKSLFLSVGRVCTRVCLCVCMCVFCLCVE